MCFTYIKANATNEDKEKNIKLIEFSITILDFNDYKNKIIEKKTKNDECAAFLFAMMLSFCLVL